MKMTYIGVKWITMTNTPKKEFFFLYGLEQYLTDIDHPELWRFKELKQAILTGDPYKIRDLILNEIYRGPVKESQEFAKAIMSYYLENDDYNIRRVLQYVSHCIEDEFIKNSARWSEIWHNKIDIDRDMNKSQLEELTWASTEISKILNLREKQGYGVTNIVEYAGKYGFLAFDILGKHSSIKQYFNIDINSNYVPIADSFNDRDNYHSWRYKTFAQDANKIKWQDRVFKIQIKNKQDKKVNMKLGPQLIINCNAEKMKDLWFKRLPKDMVVCLQTTNKVSSKNINCVSDLQQAIKKYKFTRVYYTDTLSKKSYDKFMIIGRT